MKRCEEFHPTNGARCQRPKGHYGSHQAIVEYGVIFWKDTEFDGGFGEEQTDFEMWCGKYKFDED